MTSTKVPEVRCLLQCGDVVGESAVWSPTDQTLYWVDIVGRRIQSLTYPAAKYRNWTTPDFVTSIGLCVGGGWIVGLRRDVFIWDGEGQFNWLARPEPEQPRNRLNEGKVGPDGSYWVGTMQDNLADDGTPLPITESTGAIYRIDRLGKVQQMTDRPIGVTNTLVWTRDGQLITADTLTNQIWAYQCVSETEVLGARTTFGVPFARGLPDGSCLDNEGYLWNCRVAGGGCVVRFTPDGIVDRVIELPCSWPTSCAFGGPDLSTLFVTSARFTMADEHLAANPWEGGLFALEPGEKGCTETFWKG